MDARHGHGRADRARPPPSHHRVCKPEAACYAKITEKLCLRNINAVGDLDSTLLPEVVLMLRDCGLWKAPMNSSARPNLKLRQSHAPTAAVFVQRVAAA